MVRGLPYPHLPYRQIPYPHHQLIQVIPFNAEGVTNETQGKAEQ